MFINKLLKLKLRRNFRYFKLKPGGIVLISRYNNFLIKSDNYGIKLNALNMKKLKENRGSLPFLKVLRKSNKNIYKKFSYRTELHYDIIHNEFSSFNNLDLPVNTTKKKLSLDGFSATIFKKIGIFHAYSFIIKKFSNIAQPGMLLNGFRASHSHSFYPKSRPIFNALHTFGQR
jgi:hypothetical protein